MRNCTLEIFDSYGKAHLFNVNGKDTFLFTKKTAVEIGRMLVDESQGAVSDFRVWRDGTVVVG